MSLTIYGWDHTVQRPANPIFKDGAVASAEDWLGNRFAVGEQVAYCIGAGRGQMMAIGTVLEIRAKAMKGNRYRYAVPGEVPTRVVDWSHVGRGKVHLIDLDEDYHAISVKVLTRKTSGNWNNEHRTRPAWVNAINITALPLKGIPE
jgi:hypothetical protein